MAHPITVLVKFSKDGKTLHEFKKRVDTAEGFREAIDKAHEGFRKANPDVMLFDGVNVLYDKAD